MEGVSIIESSLGTRHGDSLKNLLFILAHYQTLLKTIAWAPSYFFSSLTNDIHIMGPMNEIIRAFDHLSTQLALIGLTIKMAKCKLWNPSWNYPCIKILLGYTLVTNGLGILCLPMRSQDFSTHFLDEVLSQDVVHIDDLPFLGNIQVILDILSSCVNC